MILNHTYPSLYEWTVHSWYLAVIVTVSTYVSRQWNTSSSIILYSMMIDQTTFLVQIDILHSWLQTNGWPSIQIKLIWSNWSEGWFVMNLVVFGMNRYFLEDSVLASSENTRYILLYLYSDLQTLSLIDEGNLIFTLI